MDMQTATVAAIDAAGGTAEVARELGVHISAPSQWKARGRVPADRVLALEAACHAEVTRYQLRPDVFGER